MNRPESLQLGREGGHSRSRVAHAMGDATGREIMRAMISWTSRLRNVHVRQHTFTLDLLTCDGVCRGAVISDRQHGLMLVWAKQTILCTRRYWSDLPRIDQSFGCHR